MTNRAIKNAVKFRRALGTIAFIKLLRNIYFPKPAKCHGICLSAVRGKRGLEIGGPSRCFSKGPLRIYDVIGSLDNCNFSSSTPWEPDIVTGATFKFSTGKPNGVQYIAEITRLTEVVQNTYDFVISAHTLEHTANPLKALFEIEKLLNVGGTLILVLPHKDYTFDRKRNFTTFEHVLDDYKKNVGEDDGTHIDEWLGLYDANLDFHIDDNEQLKERTRQNFQNRCVHQHVFSPTLLREMCSFSSFEVIQLNVHGDGSIILLARKID